jgi:hypothetical protein
MRVRWKEFDKATSSLKQSKEVVAAGATKADQGEPGFLFLIGVLGKIEVRRMLGFPSRFALCATE